MTLDPFKHIITKLWFDPISDLCVGYFQNDRTNWQPNAPESHTVEGTYELPDVRLFDPIGYPAKALTLFALKNKSVPNQT